MFAFLSRLRLMGAESIQGDSADDTSSLNRSLNLPWPVTESSSRRPRAGSIGSTPPRVQTLGQAPAPQAMNISYPIPRITSNALTGIDEQNNSLAAPYAHGSGAGIAAIARPIRATPPQAASRTAWYEPEKPRRLGSPPEVVQLDSNIFVPESSDDENLDETAPPTYSSTYANISLEVLPHPADQYSSQAIVSASVLDNLAQLPPRPSRPVIPFDDDDGEGEFYNSPFDSDVEDAVPVAPRSASTSALTSISKLATMPKSRWGLKLQLHAAQSMPSLPASIGSSARHSHATEPRQTHPSHGVPALELPQSSMAGSAVETDVYNHAYSYPFMKQLSPIAELDYFSPVAESPTHDASLRFARSGNVSTGSHKDSPGTESLSVAGAALLRKDSAKESAGEKESLKTRSGSGRTGSGGSVSTVNGMISLSRAGSVSMSQTNGSPSEIMRPSPVYSSPFLTRHLNRTVSQSSSKSDTQSQTTYVPATPTQVQCQTGAQQTRSNMIAHLLTSAVRSSTSVNQSANVNATKEVILTPTSADTTGTATGTMYTPTSTLQGSGGQTPTSPSKQNNGAAGTYVQSPPPAIAISHASDNVSTVKIRTPMIPSLPSIGPLDIRFSQISISDAPRRDRSSKAASAFRKGVADVERMSVIHSDEGHHNLEDVDDYEDNDYDDDEYEVEAERGIEEDDEEYERESLHAESFVTAGTNDGVREPEQGMELITFTNGDAGGGKRSVDATGRRPNLAIPGERGSNHSHTDSFILRRWDAAGSPPSEQITTSPTAMQQGHAVRWPFRAPSPSVLAFLSRTPAFWAFWLGFIFPVLWLVGGWHFTRIGECPPRVSAWEWYLWRSGWNVTAFFSRLVQCCLGSRARAANKLKKTSSLHAAPASLAASTQQRRRGKRRSSGAAERKARAGKVYPALPRWVAEKQSTDDGRMRLNDPKRSLRGIVFGYPFVARPSGASQDSAGGGRPVSKPGKIVKALTYPNRLFDLLYGVKLAEVRGRPESGRRMFDPWIQRCRYALCYAMLLLAVALCIACAWLITVNTRRVISG